MSDDTTKKENNPESKPTQKAKTADINDLKAKLGLTGRQRPKSRPTTRATIPPTSKTTTTAAKRPAQQQEIKPKPQTEQKVTQTQANVTTTAPVKEEHEDDIDINIEQIYGGGKGKWIAGIVAAAVVALFFGMILGKIMRDRRIDNIRTEEAQHLRDYFEHSVATGFGSETPKIKVIQNYIKSIQEVANKMEKLQKEPKGKQKMQKVLEEFLKKNEKFVRLSPIFTLDAAYPKVVYNAKLAASALTFIESVRKLYNTAQQLQWEYTVMKSVANPSSIKQDIKYIVMEPAKDSKLPIWQGEWTKYIDIKSAKKIKKMLVVPAQSIKDKEPAWYPAKYILKLDVAPIERTHAMVYKLEIIGRVVKLFNQLKDDADLVDYASLQKELDHYANRPMLFTIF